MKMNCAKCGKDNPIENKFCDNCGTELTVAVATTSPSGGSSGNECPACKHPNPAGSAFCESCGASMQNISQNTTPPPITSPIAPPVTPPPVSQITKVLVLPDGAEIAVQSRKSIGRLDLEKYAASAEKLWMSRYHFEIFEENGATFIQDDKSANGTKLNGTEIRQLGRQQLKNGDEIIVGDAVKVVFKMK
jgi:pSer/pThr/pTyr-binding forkhead associated (FHA) protein